AGPRPKPAMPVIIGSTTPAVSAQAMAPSTALPPARMTSAPASVDSGCAAQIIPPRMGGILPHVRRGMVQELVDSRRRERHPIDPHPAIGQRVLHRVRDGGRRRDPPPPPPTPDARAE